jgi:predicted nucleic acid-binding protein
MTEKRKIYWDANCFIAYLGGGHPDEAYRTPICVDVLENAERGLIEIWTSVFTIAEVIRRKLPPPKSKALPKWAKPIREKAPEALVRVQELWDFHCRKTAGTKALKPEDVLQLQKIFEWKFIQKIQVDETIARKAVSLSQKHGLRPADAIHAASALERKCDCFQTFDGDYSTISHLISVEEPQQISLQGSLGL